MTPETIQKLEEGFLMSLSDREASLYANIAPSTLYAFCAENPDFSERKELLKEQVKLRAKMNITGAIKEGDKSLSQWYLERRDADFNPKSSIEHSGGVKVEVTKFDGNDKDSLPVDAGGAPASGDAGQ